MPAIYWDSALQNLGKDDLIGTKGYHFEDGPYVEYQGNVPADERESLIAALNEECKKLIEKNEDVTKRMDGDVRFVTVGGLEGMCGGTHVTSLGEIKGMTITRIKKNKKFIKISYQLD